MSMNVEGAERSFIVDRNSNLHELTQFMRSVIGGAIIFRLSSYVLLISLEKSSLRMARILVKGFI